MVDSPGNDLDRMLTQARQALEAMRQGGGGTGSPEADPIEGTGTAADGRVTVTVVSGGRLKSVDIDPRGMRAGAAELGEQIVAATNAALDDLRSKATEAAGEPVDFAALGKQVEQIQNDSLRQMTMLSQAFNDAVSKARGGGR